MCIFINKYIYRYKNSQCLKELTIISLHPSKIGHLPKGNVF